MTDGWNGKFLNYRYYFDLALNLLTITLAFVSNDLCVVFLLLYH